jgi:hypothetical protein
MLRTPEHVSLDTCTTYALNAKARRWHTHFTSLSSLPDFSFASHVQEQIKVIIISVHATYVKTPVVTNTHTALPLHTLTLTLTLSL